MKSFLTFLLLLISVNTFATEIKTVRFATEATYPPFEYYNDKAEITGFDIDIAKALCVQMKATCTFSNQAFNSLIPSLALGKFDAIIAALGITAERQQQVAFTATYYEPSASFVAENAAGLSLAKLNGKVIGVQGGSTFESYLQKKYGDDITIKLYASIQDAFLDLKAKRVDVVLADTPIALTWLKENSNNKTFNVIDKPITDHNFFGSGYGIAVRKDATALRDALNKALSEIKVNGTYDKIYKQYFSS